MADWGIKISEAGYDVKTATAEQLIMTSSLNALKVKLVGVTTSTVAHGLAYTPIFFAMNKISSTKYGIVGQVYFSGIPSSDSTNFNAGGGESKYYIFYQEGANP